MVYCAVVLAAGRATRFGGGKLQALLDGRPLLDYAIDVALAAPVERVIVVTRPGAAPEGTQRIVPVEVASTNVADSLRAGLKAGGEIDGAFIFLGDMPRVPTSVARRLADAIGSAVAAFPIYKSFPGHPVLLARRGFELVDSPLCNEGLGRVLRSREDIVRMFVDEPGVVADVDFRADLTAVQHWPGAFSDRG